MSQPNTKLPASADRERETAQARANMLDRARAQGVEPFDFDAAFGEGAEGQSQEEIQQEVDEFLRMIRETRDVPSTRSME